MARTQHVLTTMMGLRHSKEFVTSNLKEWESYASRLMLYLEINNVSSSAEKCVVLFSSCESSVFKLVESLIAPA
ncbi:hypothetical protein T02_2988 [Trichinella nativa]|uniref:Uncharacterized protein n=1 Tax=Trichinella nativa TaxID=6335 RepID=A0A0V1LQ86_9BILA|nr:hypothetical protein T06_16390 [Trichinella sp. T6]KRZ61702.1 hypothetical protein T02_2988 [Trichinella nativa]